VRAPQTAADPESATYPYSREEFEAIRECVQSVPRGLLRAARRHIQALDVGAFAGGTPKQNAHDDIKNLAEWVSAGLTLECGAVARDHLAQNRLRRPVKLGQHVTPGDLGASPFQTSFDELMTCLGNFEMAYRHVQAAARSSGLRSAYPGDQGGVALCGVARRCAAT
jgi:hypothetical protein